MSAISADQKAGEHIALPLMGAALADLAPLLLDLLKDRPLNDGVVNILEDDPVFPVIGKPLFVLVRLGVGLEVENVAAILLLAEVQLLRAENAYLKNLQALVLEEEQRQRKKRR